MKTAMIQTAMTLLLILLACANLALFVAAPRANYANGLTVIACACSAYYCMSVAIDFAIDLFNERHGVNHGR